MSSFIVVDGSLNVRQGPSLLASTLGMLEEGDVVTQTGGTEILSEVGHAVGPSTRTWMRFDGGDIQGWVSVLNLAASPEGDWEVAGASGANVRDEPMLVGSSVLANLPAGTLIQAGALVAELASPSPDVRRWVRLDLAGGRSGWASMKLLRDTTLAPKNNAVQYRVTAQVLHVRAAASIESAIAGDLRMGQTVPEGAIAMSDGRRWMKIASPAGFASMKFLSKIASGVTGGAPPWLAIARGQEGIKERSGSADNPEVVKFLKSCAMLDASSQSNDETAWCSAFVNWCVEQAGFEGTESAAARSWMHWGKPIPTPVPGCIVVLSRGADPSKGHVGFFVKEDSRSVFLLGGNQSDSVNVTAHAKSRILRNGLRMNR